MSHDASDRRVGGGVGHLGSSVVGALARGTPKVVEESTGVTPAIEHAQRHDD
jgi:hypothetical protein